VLPPALRPRPARVRAGAWLLLAVALVLLVAVASGSARATPAYTTTPGKTRPTAHFSVTYKGSGSYSTVFHGEPHNPNGPDDKNDAHDSSTQSWAIKYRGGVTIPTCGDPTGDLDPCNNLAGPKQAKGPTHATGRVNHKHVDGIYHSLNRTVKCELHLNASKHRWLQALLGVRYIPESNSIGVTAYTPVSTAITNFPGQCPKQGDPIDRILDFYATPGFSFADGYGPDRWFTSREIVIPSAVFHRSATIRIPLHVTGAGRSPKGCRVKNPSFEHCKTGGNWNGVLTFKETK
jgi:hypothetical protein